MKFLLFSIYIIQYSSHRHMSYDYIIIGSGPSGLTLATRLSLGGNKILVLERDSVFGGCHHVKRQNGLFSEHGPRVYSSSYLTFDNLLRDLGLGCWNDYFTKYKYGTINITLQIFKRFKLWDIILLSLSLISYKGNQSIHDGLYKGISKDLIDYIDRLCRLLDGGTIKTMTSRQFINMIDEGFFYSFYQPKIANDMEGGFIKDWIDRLQELGVDFVSNVSTIDFNEDFSGKYNVITNMSSFECKRMIFCIPPKDLLEYDLFENMMEFQRWEKDVQYNNYISITYHWNLNVDVDIIDKWGFVDGPWGIMYVVMSDYFNDYSNNESSLIISLVISIDDAVGSNNKTARESSEEELISEAFKQLKNNQPNLTSGYIAVMNQSEYKKGHGWTMTNNAFMNTKYEFIDFNTKYKGIFNCGTHNGRSSVSFTSLESAVQNATTLYNLLENDDVSIHSPFRLSGVIIAVMVVIIMLLYCNQRLKANKQFG